MTDHAPFPHLFETVLDQRVLVGVQIDVVGDRLVDEIAAGTGLRGGQRIKRVNLFGDGAEADGFLGSAHNPGIIACIICLLYTSRMCIRDSAVTSQPRVKHSTGESE